MRRHTFMRSAFLFTTVFALAACGDDDDNGTGPDGNDDLGTLNASVTGDVSETVSGGAIFAEDPDGSWGLFMGGDEDDESAIWFAGEGGRPSTGTHAFDVNSEDVGAFYVHGATGNFYFAEEGELVITQSSDSRVVGNFEFTGVDLEGATVSVEGSFNAPNVEE